MVRLTDYELASRLSYLLWQSMPDDELRQASEILVRLAISLMSARATALDTNDEAAVRAFAQTFLAPMVW